MKGYLISQNFWGMWRDQKNENSHMNYLITYMFTSLEHKKKRSARQVAQWNEMLSLLCITLGFTSKNEEYNSKENEPDSRYLKNFILQKVVKQ